MVLNSDDRGCDKGGSRVGVSILCTWDNCCQRVQVLMGLTLQVSQASASHTLVYIKIMFRTCWNTDCWALSSEFLILILIKPEDLHFLKDFIYSFLERGERREKERERNNNVWLPLVHPLLGTWTATQAYALTGNQTGDPLVRRLVLNPLSHISQGRICIFNKET